MEATEWVDRLEAAVMLESDDAAIRFNAIYTPQAGTNAKVFPPTYIETAGEKYHLEQRWQEGNEEPVDVVVMDSFQSQANRIEAELLRERSAIGLPLILLETEVDGESVTISNLEAPHRSRDAYFLDGEINGEKFDTSAVGQALNRTTLENATALLRYAPADLIYGVWDSHRGKRIALKFPRSYTSEMTGWHVLRGKKGATKGDPLALPGQNQVPLEEWRPDLLTNNKKKNPTERMSEIGHGMIPVGAEEQAGGVSVRRIGRDAVLSLTGLARFGFPIENGDATRAGRTVLAAIALHGDRLAFAHAGLHLRSGSDLVLTSENIEWVQSGNRTDQANVDLDLTRQILDVAIERLEAAGISWDPQPIVVNPSDRLQEQIVSVFTVPTLDAEE